MVQPPAPSYFTGTDDIVVEQAAIVAQRGWWARNSASTTVFYKCMSADACLPGGNGTKSVCRAGYSGTLCAVCSDGYFEQFGRCVAGTV